MSRTLVYRKLIRLGACGMRVRYYAKFGNDYEAAIRAASRSDLEWLADRIQIPQVAVDMVRAPKSCRQLASVAGNTYVRRDHVGCAVNVRAVIRKTLATIGIRKKRRA